MPVPFLFGYDDLGRRVSLMRGNGTVTSYGYDMVSRLASLGHDLAGTTHDVTATFTHDPASGIKSRARDNDAYAFSGFANLNRTDTLNGLNQVTATGAASVSHDTRGNTTAVGSTAYGYNVENWMSHGAGLSQLYPDPAGRLIRTLGSADTRYAWDGNDLAVEMSASGAVLRRYVHGPGMDEPLVWYEGSGTSDRRWLHADERGSIVAASNGSGASIATNKYDEYGVSASGNVGSFGYTGQLWLPELGSYYYKARIYNPALGRFMQTDPIGYGAGLNLYAYVKGDPVNKVDPTGLTCVEVWEQQLDADGNVIGQTFLSLDCGGGGGGDWLPDWKPDRFDPGGWDFGNDGDGGLYTPPNLENIVGPILERAAELFCSIPPLEISAGADAYLGIGASASLGASFDIRTLQLRGSVGATLGVGFGGGVGIGGGGGADEPGFETAWTGTVAAGPGSISASRDWTTGEGGVSGGLGPKFGGGAWGGISGKYTSKATPNLTGACGG